MPQVSSSVIKYVDYNSLTKILTIRFVSGNTYKYRNVPESIYVGLLNSSSKGSYFNRYIKDCYSH